MSSTSTVLILAAAALAMCLATGTAQTCGVSTLKGIGTGTNEVNPAIIDGILSSPNAPPQLWVPLANIVIGGITTFETPIQFRLAAFHGTNGYNTVAAFHPTAIDTFGRVSVSNARRRCAGSDAAMFKRHEELAALFFFGYSGVQLMPFLDEAVRAVFAQFTIDFDLLNLCGANDIDTPWCLAKKVVDEVIAFGESDGWNADGSMANKFNKMPYKDFDFEDSTGVKYKHYTPINDPWKLRRDSNWQPLLETDGNGYFSHQEHVTPFAGFTGRLFGIDRCEFAKKKADKPRYDYSQELCDVIERTRVMASDDRQKMLIEYFDSKFTSILPLQIEWSFREGLSLFDFWHYDATLVTTMYHATMLVWREKVRFDAVRPTSLVHDYLAGVEADTWAGPFEGEQNIDLSDWQPWVRTMPHAEYPSGSACVCTTFAQTIAQLSGTDQISPPLSTTFPAGSSKTEPGATPAAPVTETFSSWSDIADKCGESRLWGGMHFSASVPGGNKLCDGLADSTVVSFGKLVNGDASGALADINDVEVKVIPSSRWDTCRVCKDDN